MRVRKVVLGSLVALLSTWTSPARAKKEKSDSFAIERIDYSGEGCPPGSVAASATADAGAFIVVFSRMFAQAGPGVDAAAAKQKCQVHLQLAVPKGWSYALTAVDFRGYAAIDTAVVASQATTYHMSGESPESTAAFRWQGAFDDEYAVADVGGGAPPYWSRCGGGKNLMITTTITVDNRANRAGGGLLELDDVDGQLFHLEWQTCR